MNHAVDHQFVECDEQAKASDATHRAIKFRPQMLARIHAFEPGRDFARRFVGAALVLRTMRTERIPIGFNILAALQHRLDRAMHQEVRIAADRRGEVCVLFIRETKVADVVRVVLRLLHRAQHDAGNQLCIGAALDQLRKPGVVLGLRIVTATERQPHTAEKLTQIFQLRRCRPGVNAVQRGMLVRLQISSRTDVGGEHAFLNQLVRIIAHHGNDALDAPALVEQHLRFHRLELDGAALTACGEQGVINLFQRLQMRHQVLTRRFLALFRRRAIWLGQYRSDLGVSETRMRVHYCGVKLVALDLARCADHHVAGHHQAVYCGIERAQPVGQLLRQHRNHAARKIDRGRALTRIRVQGLAGNHVVADIGNGDDQAERLAFLFAVHRIVEIARIFTVNRHQWQRGEIDPAGVISFAQRLG